MRLRFTLFWIVAALALQVSVSDGAPKKKKKAPAAPSAETAKLTFDSGKSVMCLTPAWAEGGMPAHSGSSTVKVTICGKTVPASGWVAGAGYQVGLDADGDGMVNSGEYRNVAKGGSTILTAKVRGKQLCVRVTDIQIHYDENKKTVTSMRWKMQGAYGWVGKIGAVPIRILDEDLNGKYGNNGKDAICIGKGKLAVPLRPRHRIGKQFYELKISEDGSSLEYKQLKDPKCGLVRAPMSDKALLGLVLEGGNGAYDIRACGRTGIPQGTYRLLYGAIGDLKSPMTIYMDKHRRRDALKYEIQADKTNLIRMGPPLQLVFAVGIHADKKKPKTYTRIDIRPPTQILGVGGELYGPIRFPNVRSKRARPSVAIMQGRRYLAREVLPERHGKVGHYSWNIPKKKSIRGLRVAVAMQTRALGKVVGTRTIKQIVEREAFAPPKTDKPSVVTSPWKRPGKRTRPVKPKPPSVVKKPTTRPTSKDPKSPKPPASAGGKERAAERLLKLARSYRSLNRRDKAMEKLEELIRKYPDTKAAATAKHLLEIMK